jgi:phosphatidylserine/phosphatidylglycerophosphate/cardiolipin synthase-like enzyme
MNLDSVSLLYNFEANVVTTNDRFSKELKSHFYQDLQETKEVTLRDLQKRFIGEKIISFFIHLIKRFL